MVNYTVVNESPRARTLVWQIGRIAVDQYRWLVGLGLASACLASEPQIAVRRFPSESGGPPAREVSYVGTLPSILSIPVTSSALLTSATGYCFGSLTTCTFATTFSIG
jgi:hypothetical protein